MSIRTHITECRFVIRPSDIPFAGVCEHFFQAGTYTGWGIEGVKAADTMTYIRFSLADAQPDGIVVGTVRCSV